jgi:hypothetical protein
MAEKHIFIGLGGSGVNTVAKVKFKIYEKLTATRYKSRLDLLNETYRFIFVDTDSKDIQDNNEEYRNRYEHGKVDFINPGIELIDLGDQNPVVIHSEAQKRPDIQINKRILEACDEKVAATMPNKNLRHGAGAFRIKSRIAFARKAEAFLTLLRSCIKDLNSISGGAVERNTIYYWVVSSSNGGTGSGILNDVLYYVNMTHKQLIDKEDADVGLLLYMPQFYIDANATNERYPKNAFALLSELEAFQCLSSLGNVPVGYHRLALNRDYHQFDTEIAYRPFNYCIPVDYQTDKNTNMGSVINMYNNTAELLYYIHSGSGGQGFRSILDNFIAEIQSRSTKSFLIPMGYIALRKPEKDFEDYMHLRLRYELLQYGIVGAPVADRERETIRKDLYNNVIEKHLFGGEAASIRGIFRNLVTAKLEDELPDNLILDSDNKTVKELPPNITNADGDRIVADIERAIHKKQGESAKVLEQTEAGLWRWVEENALRYGLNYVYTALNELDGYCTEKYNVFTIDQKGKSSQRKVKQQHIDDIARELDNLYQESLKVTISERLSGKNREDVSRYFFRLKDCITAKTDLLIDEQIFDVLRQLCVGDNGIIDKIKRYVSNLLAEAQAKLSGEKGAHLVYLGLAKSFLEKGYDVTSVYLPDIQTFADGYGWKDRHQFAEWYAQVIHPTEQYERGKGFAPLRNGHEKSLEGFLLNVIEQNRDRLLEKGYINGENSLLFSNTKIGNPKKIIEDILQFAEVTLEKRYSENTVIQQEWLEKSLSNFYDELDREQRDDIKKRLDPCLFFSYNHSIDNNLLTTGNIYVADNERIAKDILGYTGNNTSKFSAGNNPSMIYTLRTKMGLSFDFYRTYDLIKREYDKTSFKEEFHFHAAFANSNGDYQHIPLPKELEPELITFALYLLMDGFKDVLSPYYHASVNAFDKDNYTNTPFVLEEQRALVAKKSNVGKRGENICLTVRDGEKDVYGSLVFGNAENPYVVMYDKFKSIYVDNSLGETIRQLIKDVTWLAREKVEQHYDNVRTELISKFDRQFRELKSRDEKKFISDILEALTGELSTVEKFLK